MRDGITLKYAPRQEREAGSDSSEVRYEVVIDGAPTGRLYVWPHGGTVAFDPDGNKICDLSAQRGPKLAIVRQCLTLAFAPARRQSQACQKALF